jgi:cobalt/nickel transport system permease protein
MCSNGLIFAVKNTLDQGDFNQKDIFICSGESYNGGMIPSNALPPFGLFAVHLSDGVISESFWIPGVVVGLLLVQYALWRLREEDIPRMALLTAAFFIASLIHIRVPPTSVHLLLNGLLGIVLGSRACLGIGVGLVLQVGLLGHGGWTTLGLNQCVIAGPALVAALAYPRVKRWCSASLAGGLLSATAVVLAALFNSLILYFGGIADWRVIATTSLLAHLPIAVVEGVLTGIVVGFLEKVKPEMLNRSPSTKDDG